MCNKTVGDFRPALKLVPDWFVTSKIFKKLLTALYADDNILSFLMNILLMPHFVVIKWIFLVQILITLVDIHYDEDDPKSIIYISSLAWYIKFKKRKALK